MIKSRDAVWGVLGGILLVLVLQTYPLIQAERLVERDANLGFLEAFQGRRMVDGTIIQLPNSPGVALETTSSPIDFVSEHVTAEHVSWNGNQVELVVHHVIGFDRKRDDANIARDVLVRLSKDGQRFRYEHFQVRGQAAFELPIAGNPWLTTLQGNGPARWDENRMTAPVTETWQ